MTLARLADAAKTEPTSVLANMIQQSLLDDFIPTMQMLSKFEVKESKIDVSAEVGVKPLSLPESLELIAQAARDSEEVGTSRTH